MPGLPRNDQLAEQFELLGDLMELEGADLFRINAYRKAAARIRETLRLHSPDIYGEGDVFRDVYSMFVQVRPGNSGGPLVSRAGRVLGVVFAASVADSRTGYALTAQQVSTSAAAGRTATAEVDTGDCA